MKSERSACTYSEKKAHKFECPNVLHISQKGMNIVIDQWQPAYRERQCVVSNAWFYPERLPKLPICATEHLLCPVEGSLVSKVSLRGK